MSFHPRISVNSICSIIISAPATVEPTMKSSELLNLVMLSVLEMPLSEAAARSGTPGIMETAFSIVADTSALRGLASLPAVSMPAAT